MKRSHTFKTLQNSKKNYLAKHKSSSEMRSTGGSHKNTLLLKKWRWLLLICMKNFRVSPGLTAQGSSYKIGSNFPVAGNSWSNSFKRLSSSRLWAQVVHFPLLFNIQLLVLNIKGVSVDGNTPFSNLEVYANPGLWWIWTTHSFSGYSIRFRDSGPKEHVRTPSSSSCHCM